MAASPSKWQYGGLVRYDRPSGEIVHSLMQDHVNPRLLFAGTEFGLYFTVDEGEHWVQLEGNLPTIQVRDIDIQRRESDLALGTFGRGYYILDDYSPLRTVSEEALASGDHLLPVKDALLYIEKTSRQLDRGPLAMPGSYSVTVESKIDERFATLAGPQDFDVVPLNLSTLAASDRAAATAFPSCEMRRAGATWRRPQSESKGALHEPTSTPKTPLRV
jgi:hypothetical protein